MADSIKQSIKKILKRTPLYSVVFRYRHFKRTVFDKYKNLYDLYRESKKVSPPDIKVVNFNANDICNSKCAMCNIWEQKQGFEVSPDDLYQILKDPLYKNLNHVGITGGEPTLREDLPLLYEAVIKAVPDIHGLSIITNAIREKDVISRIDEVIEVCKKHDKYFSMMVSLDGYGAMHDKVRGREGNFITAINVINYFRNKNTILAIGCTISKVNVWDVDDLLDFMRQEKIYGRFRVAEFIKRLYNDNKANVIRNFDEDEIYHLILFFYKLIFTFETEEIYKRTYYSIINILSGGNRLIGCPYHNKGVVLNSRGELGYCAPKSNIIGNTLNDSSLELYNNNLGERARILTENCDSCIHDYHEHITYPERKAQLVEEFWREYIKVNSKKNFSTHLLVKKKKEGRLQVFITGWYGTETVGDKAILAGIIEEVKDQYGEDIHIVISSLFPHITHRTVKELSINATIIGVYTKDFVAYCKGSDIVIMGGGPLMDLAELSLPLVAFKLAKASKGKTIVYGCGIGPLHDDIYIDAVKQILNLSDEIKLRDQKSINQAKAWLTKDTPVSLSGDPAKKYLKRYAGNVTNKAKRNVLTCYLREWTYEYNRNISYEDFLVRKKEFEQSLANLIKRKAEELQVSSIVLDHMHNFVVGNDDRDFSRYFIKNYFSDYTTVPISYNKYLSTVDSIVNSMVTSSHNISMRFHSVVFAHTLGTSFTAVDYTNGGKIYNYLNDNNALPNLLSIDDLINEYSI